MCCFISKFKGTFYSIRNRKKLIINRKRNKRKLEIGPGEIRLQGFETLNIVDTGREDYVANAADLSLFADGEFNLVYASHILEHLPWYHSTDVIKEWVRIIEPGGTLEIWVPDGLKVCRTLVAFEDSGQNDIEKDGWYKLNEEKDPALWASGRLFTYGDGTGERNHENWHRAMFTPRLLKRQMEAAGLVNVSQLDSSDVRGYDHGWINLGMRGEKQKGGA